MNRNLLIVATSFQKITGGLIWISNLAAYAKRVYKKTTLIDLSQENVLMRSNRFLEIIYYIVFCLWKKNFFVFIDHRLHLRFSMPLLLSSLLKKNGYATICHHVFYRIKDNVIRKMIEYLSEKIFLKNARFIVVPSEKTALDVRQLNIGNDKIVIINPTCAYRNHEIPQRPFRNNILFVGNLEPRKGLHIAIEALSLIKDAKFSFHVIGDCQKHKGYYAYVKDLVIRYGLSTKVIFHGRVTSDDIERFYRNANIFVFPSRHEGYGMVLLEAMSFALPIVATDIPTTREIVVNNVNGYLCPVDDATCLSQRFKKLLNNRNLQIQIGKENFKASRKFRSWDDVVQQTFDSLYPYLSNE